LHLPRLHTLQFADDGSTVARSVSTWDLPSLRNLVFTEGSSKQGILLYLEFPWTQDRKARVYLVISEEEEEESEIDLGLLPPPLPQLGFLSMPFPEPRDLPFVAPLITSPKLEDVEFPIDIRSLMPQGEESLRSQRLRRS
jgi:hypothetical protein